MMLANLDLPSDERIKEHRPWT